MNSVLWSQARASVAGPVIACYERLMHTGLVVQCDDRTPQHVKRMIKGNVVIRATLLDGEATPV